MKSSSIRNLDDFNPIINVLMENDLMIKPSADISPEIHQIIQKFAEKLLDESNIEEIIKKIKNGVKIDELKKEYQFAPPLNYQELEKIINYVPPDNRTLLYIAYNKMKSAAMWIFADDSYHTELYFNILLKSIADIDQIIYRYLATDLFVFYCAHIFHLLEDNLTSETKDVIALFVDERRTRIAKLCSESYLSYYDGFIKFIFKNIEITQLYPFIQTFIDLYDEKTSVHVNLHAISAHFKYFLAKLNKSLESQKFCLCILEFYEVYGKYSELTREDSNLIYQIITKSVDINDPGYHIFESLTNIIIGEPGRTSIKNGNIVFNFLKIFIHSEQCSEAFSYIINLCDTNISNVFILGKYEVDYDLVNLIFENEDDQRMIPVIGLSLQLVSNIAQFSSTPKVVSKLLSLLKPMNGVLSTLHATYVVTLFNLVTLSMKSPPSVLPIGEGKPTIFVEEIDANAIYDHIYFGFWLYVLKNTKNITSPLIKIYDNKDKSYIFNLVDNQIELRVPENQERFLFSDKISYDRWSFILVGFTRDASILDVVLYIDDVKSQETATIENLRLDRSSQVMLQIGSNQTGRSYMGPIGMFNRIEDALAMYTIGPRLFDRDAILYVTPQVIEGELNILQRSNCNISAELKGEHYPVPTTFFDILTRNFMMENLIPLFRTLDMKLVNGDTVSPFCGAVVDIIIDSLSSSKFTEEEFITHHGFEVIGHCLAISEQRNLTYHQFQKFYFVFITSKNDRLRRVILKNILLNPDIWVHASDDDQKLIAKDWGINLYEKNYQICREICNFDTLLMYLRVYYWYEPVEQDVALCTSLSKYPRTPNMSVKDIRDEIIYILTMLAKKQFTEENLKSILAHAVGCKDPQQTIDLLFLIKVLIVSEEQPFNKVESAWSYFNVLHHLVNNDNEELSFAGIETIAALHLLEHFSTIPVKYHVGVLIEELPLSSLSIEYFAKLIPLINKYPDFYPLCFYYVLHEGEKTGDALLQYIKINSQFAKKRTWAFWPILTALTFGGELMEGIMEFLAKCSNEHWRTTFSLIQVIAEALGVDDARPKSVYMHSLTKSLLDQPLLSFEYLHDFFDLVIFHLFFRHKEVKKPMLENLLLEIDPSLEVLSESCEAFTQQSLTDFSESEDRVLKNFNRREFMEKLDKVVIDNEYNFGLNMDKDGKWLDAYFALDVIKQARRTRVQTYHNFSCMLASFALKERKEEAREAIKDLLDDNVAEQMFIDMMMQERSDHTDCYERIIRDCTEHNDTIVNYTKEVIDKIKHYIEKVLNGVSTLIENTDNSIFSDMRFSIRNFIADVSLMHNFCDKKCEAIEHSFTAPSGPWFTPKDKKQKMLSMYNCYENIPMKMIEYDELPEMEDTVEYLKNKYTLFELMKIPDFCEISFEMENDNQKIVLTCDRIEITGTTSAKLFVYTDCIEIFNKKKMIHIDARNIKQIMFRMIRHLPTGLEIFTISNESYLLNLDRFNSLTLLTGIKSLDEYNHIEIQTKMPKEYLESKNITEKWVKHEITNFEYIMELNNISGRSFNDLSNYPVIPKFLELDHNYKVVIRDFSDISNYDLSSQNMMKLLSFVEPFKTYCNKPVELLEALKSEVYVPEYFVDIDLFHGVELPFGFKSSEELITFIFEAFENFVVSEKLPAFIDNFFGINQNKFKFVNEDVWSKGSSTDIDYFMSVVNKINDEGQLPARLFEMSHVTRYPINVLGSPKLNLNDIEIVIDEDNTDTILCKTRIDDESIVYGTKDGYVVRTNPDIRIKISEESIVSIHCDKNLIACGCTDGKFKVLYTKSLEYYTHFPFFTSTVSIVKISERFGLVYGSTDEFIFIYSLAEKKQILCIETHKNATSVCVSNIYGIVCFSFGNDIFTFSINGDKLSSRNFDMNITKLEFVIEHQKEMLMITDGSHFQYIDPVVMMIPSK